MQQSKLKIKVLSHPPPPRIHGNKNESATMEDRIQLKQGYGVTTCRNIILKTIDIIHITRLVVRYAN